MKLLDVLTEATAAEKKMWTAKRQLAHYQQWKRRCLAVDPTVTFTGYGWKGRTQAVITDLLGQTVIGEWDGKTMTGTVNK